MSGINVGSVNSLSTVIREAQEVFNTVKTQEAADAALREAQKKQEREIAEQKVILARQQYLEGKITAIRPKLQELILASVGAGKNTTRLFELPVTYGCDYYHSSQNSACVRINDNFYIGTSWEEFKTGVEILSKLSSECPMFGAFLKELIDAGCKVDVESAKSRFVDVKSDNLRFGNYTTFLNYTEADIERIQKIRAYLILTLSTS